MADQTQPATDQIAAFEKYKYKIELFKWIIGSVVLVIVTAIIDWGFKDRAAGLQEIQQYDKYATELIILNDNPKSKRMLAQYFSTVTPSEKLRNGWKLYYAEVDREYQKLLADDSIKKSKIDELMRDSLNLSTQQKAQLEQYEKERDRTQKLINQPIIIPKTSSVPTVYIQFSNEEQRGNAKQLADKIGDVGFNAPGIELVKITLSNNEIRYFHESDLSAANSLQVFLKEQKLDAIIKFMPALSAKAKEGIIELWLK